MKTLGKVFFGFFFVLAMTGVQAATISLVPVSGPVGQGGQETFNLVANFGAQSVLGGASDFSWNSSVMTFAGFSFSAALASPIRDPNLDAKVNPTDTFDLQSSSLVSIGFGNFSGISLPNDTVIGTLTFNAVGTTGSSTFIGLSDSVKWGGFNDTSLAPIPVTYTGATATVIPLPAAFWLLFSGLSPLGFVLRRKVC